MRGVSVMPGATALARTTSLRWAARYRVYPAMAAFAVVYQSDAVPIQFPATDAVLTRLAPAGGRVPSQASATRRMLPTASTSASSKSNGTALGGPALLTRYRTGPSDANPAATASGSPTSATTADA